MNIGILDYAIAGNFFSIAKVVEKLGYSPKIVKNVKNIDKLIIPGVGSYKEASQYIENHKEELLSFKGDILGICLGMQLLVNKGYEFGEHKGIGIIDGECIKMTTNAPLPHIGWNTIKSIKESTLLKGVEDRQFYFMHSYEVINYTDIVAISEYEGHKFVSVIEKDNIFGVQFHPEKSRDAGIKVIENFLKVRV
jgi:imidazole glycerol phosphate synthase glutamine amidotransferase subunit